MSQDCDGPSPSFPTESQRKLPEPYSKAIIQCAAESKTQKEFRDMAYGMASLDLSMSNDGGSDYNYWDEIFAMVEDLCKYLPED